MLYYISSNKNHQVIVSTIKENELLIIDSFIHDHINFKRFVKSNITQLSVEILILDLSAFDDPDEDILAAIQMIRTMYEQTKIIVITNRTAGNKLLSDIFSLGILNIIATYDFLELKNELNLCLNQGKTFKEALIFKNVKDETIVNTSIELKTANKVTIAVSGITKRIGSTHNSIILASTIRKLGYMVAIVEMNTSSDFQRIKVAYNAKKFNSDRNVGNYFVLDGIDYYPDADKETIRYIKDNKSYNFVVVDYGDYKEQDISEILKNNVKILLCGSKAWEYRHLTDLISVYDNETLKSLFFGFVFTDKKDEKTIRKEMRITNEKVKEALNVFFLEYNPDAFNTYNFPDIKVILKDYLPEQNKKEKKKFWGIFEI